MMELTEQVEAHQKREEGLNTKIAEMEDLATKMEENKTQLLQQMKERSDLIEELESLKSQAEDENQKLQELLTEADNQLREVESRIGPLEQENEQMQQRFQQNELLVQSVKKDF